MKPFKAQGLQEARPYEPFYYRARVDTDRLEASKFGVKITSNSIRYHNYHRPIPAKQERYRVSLY